MGIRAPVILAPVSPYYSKEVNTLFDPLFPDTRVVDQVQRMRFVLIV